MKKAQLVIKNKKGFSAIEVLLSTSVFVVVVSAFVGAIIFGIQSQKTAGQYNQAVLLAEETFEAIRNIRDSGYSNLPSTDGTYYLSSSGNQWSLTSTPEPAINGFTRSISISTIDTSTKQIVVNINFAPSAHRTKTLSYSSKITNWIANTSGGGSPKKRGLIVYANSTDSTPYTREYDDVNNTFGPAVAMPAGAIGQNFRMEMSPTKGEAIVAYVDGSGVLRTMCYDDSTDVWTEDWSVTVGGTGNAQRYALAYENTTGNAFIAYSTDVANTNEIAYRTKVGSSSCGSSNWSSPVSYNAQRTSGQIRWMIAKPDRRAGQNRIYLAWSDTNNDLSAGVWAGASLGSEPSAALELNLEYHSSSQDSKSWDLAVESASGNAMIVWSPFGTTCTVNSTSTTASCMRYSRFTTSWSAATTIPTIADRGTNLDIAPNYLSTSNQIILGALDNNSSDLSLAYWSGSVWTGRANHDTSTATIASFRKMVAVGWLNSAVGSRSVIAYSDSGSARVDWVTGNAGTFTNQTDFTPSPLMSTVQSWVDLTVNPSSLDSLIYTASDGNNDLHAKRLIMSSTGVFTWTNSDSPGPLEASLANNTGNPFSFGFWNVIPIASNNGNNNLRQKQHFAITNILEFIYDRRRYV